MADAAPTTSLSRRAAFGAASALVIVPLTAVAETRTNPDHGLLELGRTREALRAASHAIDAEVCVLSEAFERGIPPKPLVLRRQPDDIFAIGVGGRAWSGEWIEEGDMDQVRRHYASNKIATDACGVNVAWTKRGREVIAAFENWHPGFIAAWEASGIAAKEAEDDAIWQSIRGAEAQIATMPAYTPRGLRLKAEVILSYGLNEGIAEHTHLLRSLLADLTRNATI